MLSRKLAWFALANTALGLSASYAQLLLFKALAGLGTGICFAAGARYIVARLRGSRSACIWNSVVVIVRVGCKGSYWQSRR